MAAQDPGLKLFDSHKGRGEKIEIHPEDDVLHGKIGGDNCNFHVLGLAFGFFGVCVGFRLVFLDV